MNANVSQIISQITTIVGQIISVAVLFLILGVVLQIYGVRIPQIPTIDATKLAYLCGALWLFRGGKL